MFKPKNNALSSADDRREKGINQKLSVNESDQRSPEAEERAATFTAHTLSCPVLSTYQHAKAHTMVGTEEEEKRTLLGVSLTLLPSWSLFLKTCTSTVWCELYAAP